MYHFLTRLQNKEQQKILASQNKISKKEETSIKPHLERLKAQSSKKEKK